MGKVRTGQVKASAIKVKVTVKVHGLRSGSTRQTDGRTDGQVPFICLHHLHHHSREDWSEQGVIQRKRGKGWVGREGKGRAVKRQIKKEKRLN
jgi:hypothetical protein